MGRILVYSQCFGVLAILLLLAVGMIFETISTFAYILMGAVAALYGLQQLSKCDALMKQWLTSVTIAATGEKLYWDCRQTLHLSSRKQA